MLQATSPRWRTPERVSHAAVPAAAPKAPQPSTGAVVAALSAPSIGLFADVLQGTSDAILAAAPGHDPKSALPGEAGTAVLNAHNLTFFRHLDSLAPGDAIVVRTAQGTFRFAVTGHEVVRAGTPLPDTPLPSLALVACYPLDALYATDERYVVLASLVGSILTASELPPPPPVPAYALLLPPALEQAPLWLHETGLRPGEITFVGGPSTRLTASGAAWSLTAQAFRMFAATQRALSSPSGLPFSSFGRDVAVLGLTPPVPKSIVAVGRINVTVAVDAGGAATSVTVTEPSADLSEGGTTLHGTYTISLAVSGRTMALRSVRFTDP